VVTGFATLDGRTDGDCTADPVTVSSCDLCVSDGSSSSSGSSMGMGNKAKLQALTFLWTPADGTTALSASNFAAESSITSFQAFASGEQTIIVTAGTSAGTDFSANTDLTALGDRQTLHTSCSQPIFLGLVVRFAGGTLAISGFQSDVPRTESDCPAPPSTPPPTAPTTSPTNATADFATCSCFTLIPVTEDALLFSNPLVVPQFIRPQCFMAGREGYGVNSGLTVVESHDALSPSAARTTVPCCPHFWVTCAASFWAVADNKENEMDYLGFGPGSPSDSQAIALFNAGIQIGTPNCATDPASCCGVDALLEANIATRATLPQYCYTQEALFKNAPTTRGLTPALQTCAEFTVATNLQPPTCAAVPTASESAPGGGGASAVATSTIIVAVALATVMVVGAAARAVRKRSETRMMRTIQVPPIVQNNAFRMPTPGASTVDETTSPLPDIETDFGFGDHVNDIDMGTLEEDSTDFGDEPAAELF
jgi:hypothetical protein